MKVKNIIGFIGVISLIITIGYVLGIDNPEMSRDEKIQTQFSGWNGSHYNLSAFVKESMRNPSTYEHIETLYIDKQDYLKVKMVFRGENGFGGMAKNWIWAKVDIDGNIIKIIETGI